MKRTGQSPEAKRNRQRMVAIKDTSIATKRTFPEVRKKEGPTKKGGEKVDFDYGKKSPS